MTIKRDSHYYYYPHFLMLKTKREFSLPVITLPVHDRIGNETSISRICSSGTADVTLAEQLRSMPSKALGWSPSRKQNKKRI
jgi:hypothetical protein